MAEIVKGYGVVHGMLFDKYFGEHDSIESIEWVSVFPNISRWYQKLLTLYSRCFYFKDGNPFELQMYPLFKRKTLKEVKLMGAEWIIAKTITDDFLTIRNFAPMWTLILRK